MDRSCHRALWERNGGNQTQTAKQLGIGSATLYRKLKDVTLEGSATDVWIFQIAGDLTMSSGARVVLSGGALPQNVFWQVAGFVDLGTTAHCEGVILTMTSVTLRTGASINGRILAQTAVNIDGSTVVAP